MFDSDIVEIAIGLIFVYFLLSLVASSATEWISRVTKLRASNLYDGIENMLENPELMKKFYTHPLITPTLQAYSKDKKKIEDELAKTLDVRQIKKLLRNKPSYISSRNFAMVLLEVVGKGSGLENVKALQDGNKEVVPDVGSIRQSLLALVNQAGGDYENAVTNVEKWFDDVMDRAGGWYTRKAQLITLIIAFAVAIVLNADTLTIVHQLSQDSTLRATVVSAADTYVQNAQLEGEGTGLEDATTQELRDELQSLGIPLGWAGKWEDPDGDGRPEEIRAFPNPFIPGQTSPFFRKLAGLIITGLAVSLGAPFWFDLLKKISNIRGAGAAPAPAAGAAPQKADTIAEEK